MIRTDRPMLLARYMSDRELISDALRKRILLGVIVGHVVLIVVPALYYLVANWLMPPKPKVVTVQLVSPPSEPETSFQPPAPVDPPQPKPDQPKPKPDPPKPKPQDTPKPKPTPKPIPKPKPKPKWKPLSADDIKINRTEVIRNENTPQPPVPNINISNRLKNELSQIKVGNPGQASRAEQRYFDSVSNHVYRLWQTPSKAALGGTVPTVDVRVTVAANGSVTSAKVVRRSGNAAMDASAESLLKILRSVPPPPDSIREFTITLEPKQ